jgi:hypothetical protein
MAVRNGIRGGDDVHAWPPADREGTRPGGLVMHAHRRPVLVAFVLAALLALGVAACGSGDGGGAASPGELNSAAPASSPSY